ncbi:endonuclease/exonuclease/phosphatase family protein [Methylomonas fluvii]|uniref:Endonuclease/exonuclease/phosphatase family protein n=1 Tax=Methylomonas fluvii TaxID=1854564 RepID=A0ABR9DE61_9GAMM|nr:endonuclease/exonuclease/phosphatase family protein [Methylomonas fluvii]MBD9361385.1 endonuclease/exonuclease/phosphatase family protein [Methylomonas fluvii]CAD6874328.1 hypothetical protein [Methylomonas fluvii]
MIVASWNIEKNGQGSAIEKQALVSSFIDNMLKPAIVDVLFICEVHGAREDAYVNFLDKVYNQTDWPSYCVQCLHGGHSNSYVVAIRRKPGLDFGFQGDFLGLNRGLFSVHAHAFAHYNGYLHFGHFKSGQTGLTKYQLKSAASMQDATWAITGDLNWEIGNHANLDIQGSHSHDVWQGQGTHKANSGLVNTLDWVLASNLVRIEPIPLDPRVYDMEAPDHRPLLFNITSADQLIF